MISFLVSESMPVIGWLIKSDSDRQWRRKRAFIKGKSILSKKIDACQK